MALSRSENMARIRGEDTQPELQLRKALWRRGIRYRLKTRIFNCRPDLVFRSRKLVVFIDGCFWHGCPQHYVRPRSREEFWARKLETNVLRDIKQTRRLQKASWRVLRFWEHEVRESLPEVVEAVERALAGQGVVAETRYRVLRVTEVQGRPGYEKRFLVDLTGSRPDRTEERKRNARTE